MSQSKGIDLKIFLERFLNRLCKVDSISSALRPGVSKAMINLESLSAKVITVLLWFFPMIVSTSEWQDSLLQPGFKYEQSI